MNELDILPALIAVWIALAAGSFVALLFIPAPYGRHSRPGWGPRFGSRSGWIVMEAASAACFAVFFSVTGPAHTPVGLLFLLMWESHYIYRAFVFPFRMRDRASSMPLIIVAMGLIFNGMNGYLNGRGLFLMGPSMTVAWFAGPRFWVGALLFFGGMAVNRYADETLIRLRDRRGTGYDIPYGGLYRWITCPNYLGEMIEWGGWAVATWSLPGLSFFLWTVANLMPRALSHHRWYRDTFSDYPQERKAVIPFLL